MACHKLRRRRYGKPNFLWKRSFRNCLLREIKMDLVFAVLRSMVPQPTQFARYAFSILQAQTVAPTARSSEIFSNPSSKGGSKDASASDIKQMNEENVCNEHMESIDSTDWQPLSLPTLRIEQPGGSDQLLIRIITLKRSTDLTSKLFEVLEEENLDVLHVNRFSTEETILHTIQVKVKMPSKLDMDGLKHKLYSWAAKREEKK